MTPDELDTNEEPVLSAADWSALLALGTAPERAAVVERLGADLAAQVRRPLLQRAVTVAVKARAEAWRGARSEQVAARLDDEADTATSRLAKTLAHMRVQQDEHIEPAAGAVVELCGRDLALGCWAAQEVLGMVYVRNLVMTALRSASFDRDILLELITAGISVEHGLEVAAALARYSWWPTHMRRSVVTFLKNGGDVDEVMRCLNDVAFSRLSSMQQRTALSMLQAEDTPYGMDGVAVAATLRGITLTR
ncbi:hypothetical protein CLV35_2946 [Motilibacter peucedani]|uniref:Uncharacterized protein n=1 Tax=Motilibacter peucedani TaxID=598650 RepID=A0A420XN42_9ACTN|nr:hypothetical protein [Motilibacter peucedani]RKS72697.1 hypothetical protein CLV35_2946 [Motilibacter peucedani]